MKWNKNAKIAVTTFSMVALLLTGAGCASDGTSSGASAHRGERRPEVEDPTAEELPTEVVYRAEEGDHVFAVTAFEGEVFWMVRKEENSPEYRLMSTSVGSTQPPSHLLSVDPEMFDVWNDYVASSELMVMDADGVRATRLPHGEEKEILTEEGFSIQLSLDGLVQNERYVYFLRLVFGGSDQVLRLDKMTLELEVLADRLQEPNNLVLTDDLLYFVSSGADYDVETEVLTFQDQIFRIDLNTGELSAVSDNNLNIHGAAVPVGNSLFYFETNSGVSTPLMKLSLADGSVSHVIDASKYANRLQTDGKRLFFSDLDVFVYSVDPDGSNYGSISSSRPWEGFTVSDGSLYVATGSEITREILP